MAEELDHSALDKDLVGGTTAVNTGVNTPLNLEKENPEAPSRDSTVDVDLEEKKAAAEESEDNSKPNVEYPVGFRLFAIVVALILSIFLVALDMTVRNPDIALDPSPN